MPVAFQVCPAVLYDMNYGTRGQINIVGNLTPCGIDVAWLHDLPEHVTIDTFHKSRPLFLDDVCLQDCLMIMTVLPATILGRLDAHVSAAVRGHEPVP